MAELQHTNVVRVFGVCLDPGHTCVLMQYASNGTVRDLLDRTATATATAGLPTHVAFGLLRDVVLGMTTAHAHSPAPILHRDLKPANVLLDDANRGLVSDFGLSTGADSAATGANAAGASSGGTLAYSPPEVLQAMASHRHGDTNADANAGAVESGWSTKGDVFSFGVLGWELLTGEVPYAAEKHNARSLFRAVVRDGQRCHGQAWDVPVANIDPFLAGVIKRCWAQQPLDRPDFAQLAEEFERVASEPRFQAPAGTAVTTVSVGRRAAAIDQVKRLSQHVNAHGKENRTGNPLLYANSTATEPISSPLLASISIDAKSPMDNVQQAKDDLGTSQRGMLTETFAGFYNGLFSPQAETETPRSETKQGQVDAMV